MPTEYVASSNPDFSDFVTKVSWGRDATCVELATIAPKGIQQLKDTLEGWGYDLVRREGVGEDVDVPASFDGWHATLDDRRLVNDLIRHLRRARDQAFGRDE